MTDRQENKLSMYLVVKKVCAENSSIWSTLPAFVTAYDQFTSNISTINLALQAQTQVITGYAKDKLEEKQEMIIKTVLIASAAFAYAKSINDQTLADLVNLKAGKLANFRDTTLSDVCKQICVKANEVIIPLADFGISPTDITQLQNEIADFDKFIVSPRQAIGSRIDATDDIAKTFRIVDGIIKNQLDRLIVQFQFTNKHFYTRYKSARQIIDLGVRHLKEEVVSS